MAAFELNTLLTFISPNPHITLNVPWLILFLITVQRTDRPLFDGKCKKKLFSIFEIVLILATHKLIKEVKQHLDDHFEVFEPASTGEKRFLLWLELLFSVFIAATMAVYSLLVLGLAFSSSTIFFKMLLGILIGFIFLFLAKYYHATALKNAKKLQLNLYPWR